MTSQRKTPGGDPPADDKIKRVQGTAVSARLAAIGEGGKLEDVQRQYADQVRDAISDSRDSGLEHISENPAEVAEMIHDEFRILSMVIASTAEGTTPREAVQKNLASRMKAGEFASEMIWPLIKPAAPSRQKSQREVSPENEILVSIDRSVAIKIIDTLQSRIALEQLAELLKMVFSGNGRFYTDNIVPLMFKAKSKAKSLPDTAPAGIAVHPEAVLEDPVDEDTYREKIKTALKAKTLTSREYLTYLVEHAEGELTDEQMADLRDQIAEIEILRSEEVLPAGEREDTGEPRERKMDTAPAPSPDAERFEQHLFLLSLKPDVIVTDVQIGSKSEGYVAAIVTSASGKRFAICDANRFKKAMYIFDADTSVWLESLHRPKTDFIDPAIRDSIPGFIIRKRHDPRDRISPQDLVKTILAT